MPSSYSTDLKLELMVTGEKAGLWGDITNTNLNIVQQAIAGREAISVASTNAITLAFTNGALSNGKNAVIDITGTPSGDCTVNIPDGIEKTYIVKNSTGGTLSLTVKTASGSGVTFGDNEKTTKILYSDGTNIVDTGLTDLSSDYSPQLSADLDTNSQNIQFDDAHGINDDSGNEQIVFQKTASAVNQFDVTNAATGNAPNLSATGGDTNIDLNITPKGTGRVTLNGSGKIQGLAEKVTVDGTFSTNVVIDTQTQAVILSTAAASGNFKINLRGDGSNSLDAVMDIGESITVAYINKNNNNTWAATSFVVDNKTTNVTIVYQGGSSFTAGNATSNDTYTMTAIKTAASTFTVLASQTQFA
jgi:hypothetical protein